MDIKVTKLEPAVVLKIDEMAAERDKSRNQFLKEYLSRLAIIDELAETEDKYISLCKALADKLEQSTDVIRESNALMGALLSSKPFNNEE